MSAEPAATMAPGPVKKMKANATYTEMITAAILDLNDRTGSSAPAITSWIAKHYPKLKVKKTTVGAKIRPLVQSGYLVRAKSSFKLSASARDQLRKAKAAKTNKANKKKEVAVAAKKDRGLDQISRVRKQLGLLPLVSNHYAFDDLTQIVAEHAVSPVTRDAVISANRPKKKPRTGGGNKSQPEANADPSADTAAVQPGVVGTPNASIMRGNGRAKSAYNFYQDSVKVTIRQEQPGISMPDLRKEMMARWNAMTTEEKEPFEAQGAAAKEMFGHMQSANKSADALDASPAAASTLDEGPAATSVAAVEDEREATTEGADTTDPPLAVPSVGSAEMVSNRAVDTGPAGSPAAAGDREDSVQGSSLKDASLEAHGAGNAILFRDTQGDDTAISAT